MGATLEPPSRGGRGEVGVGGLLSPSVGCVFFYFSTFFLPFPILHALLAKGVFSLPLCEAQI